MDIVVLYYFIISDVRGSMMIGQNGNFGLALSFPIFIFAQRTWIPKTA